MANLDRLIEIMARLRDPVTGCPWDLQQDMHSLRRYTLEEVYEVIDAIEHGHPEQLREELGDLLFQIVFYARLAEEQQAFGMQDIIDTIADKLVRRHPHVFPAAGQQSGRELAEIRERWEQLKEQERSNKGHHGLLGDIPMALPALQRSHKIQSRLARVGFDWDQPRAVLQQLRSELDELDEALSHADRQGCAEELGDVLFSAVNLARHLQLDAEQCLRETNSKVAERIGWMEHMLDRQGKTIQDQSMSTLEDLWQQAKQALRDGQH